MSSAVTLTLLPRGRSVALPPGTPLADVLFEEGMEFPCGGQGRCRGCRVRVLGGHLPAGEADRRLLDPKALADGWRLACQAVIKEDLQLELAQWEGAILSDERSFDFQPKEGLGVAVDLGTTTLVAQLLDLRNGNVLAVASALNDQARYGADIMSRVDFAVNDGGAERLTGLARRQVGGLIEQLMTGYSGDPGVLRRVVVVGNTVMHHLFCGLDVAPLAHAPFESLRLGLQEFPPAKLGWAMPDTFVLRFLPCLGGFVGSDLLAGLLATRLHEATSLGALLDLGTNGEVLVGNREGIACAGTAAGPAFEGARISMGMRATTGAISRVQTHQGRIQCHVIGSGAPRGICGSGLVDAVAVGLDLGRIRPSGRFADGDDWELQLPVRLAQRDIRELQLAKGAIAAGVQLLAAQREGCADALERVHLAGAFGNTINRESARRIGLLPVPVERADPVGNTALLGAKLALFTAEHGDWEFADLRAKVRHVSLHDDPGFHETYLGAMTFPANP